MAAPEVMCDIAMKTKLLRSLLREFVPNEKYPFTNPSELSYVVSTVKTLKLLSEWTTPEVQPDIVDAWKSAVDSWVNRLLALASSNLPDKCWAGVCLLGLTCQECSSERFSASYEVWLNMFILHMQPSESSHFVKAASCASLSDMFTRLGGFSNLKKDGTSQATRVVQLSLNLLNEDHSAFVLGEVMCLLCTLINSFPSSVHRHYDSVEAAIVSKLTCGKCCPSVLEKLGRGLSLLPKSRGDEASWSLMMDKILLSVNSQLNMAFQGFEEEAQTTKAMRVLLPAGKEPPPPLGGAAASQENSDFSTRRPERLLASKISSLLQCCCEMLTTSYPVPVPVPISGLLALAGRVLSVDGSLPLSSYSFMTTLNQEFICSEVPNLQFQCLEILTVIMKALGSQVLPHLAEILKLLKDYLRRCKIPYLKMKAYSIVKVVLRSMGVGLAIHIGQDIVKNILDLDFFCNEDEDKSLGTNTKVQDLSNEFHHKKRKRTKSSLQEKAPHVGVEAEMPDSLTPVSVKIAALEALEALLTVGGSFLTESLREDVDKLLITVATYACGRGWPKEEKLIHSSGEATPSWADFQVAALRALLASLLSPGIKRPPHLALGLKLFRRGTQATGTLLGEYCGHALLALEVLIHPRSLPFTDISYSPSAPGGGEPESEEDDPKENWACKDDEMEIQVMERDPAEDLDSGTNALTTSGNIPPNKGLTSNDDILDKVEPKRRRAASVENDVTCNEGIEASTPEHVVEATSNEFSVLERISATLSNIDRSKGMMFEPDDDAADVFPDIVDSDPDSD